MACTPHTLCAPNCSLDSRRVVSTVDGAVMVTRSVSSSWNDTILSVPFPSTVPKYTAPNDPRESERGLPILCCVLDFSLSLPFSLRLPLPSFFFSLAVSDPNLFSFSLFLFVRAIVVVCLSRTSTSHDTATSMDGRGLALRGRCDLFNCIGRADGNRFSTVGRGHVRLPTWYTPVLRPANRPRLGPVSQPIPNCWILRD